MTTSQSGPLLPKVDKSTGTICELANYDAIEQLFNAPWFQRTWTTQEACLSNQPWVMAGRSTCHWEDCFGSAAVNERLGIFHTQSLNSPKLANDSVPAIRLHGFHCAIAIWDIRHAPKSRRSLIDCLVKTRHTQTGIPHDNVYGIMGLFENDIVPDYTMETTELWRNISLQILKTEIENGEWMLQNGERPYHAFHFLSCVDHGVDNSGNLPSWVVDWSKPRVTTSLAYSTSVVGCFNAGQSSAVSSVLRTDQHGKILSLKAKVFDTIAHLSPILDDAKLEADFSSAANTTLRTCIAHAKTVPAHCSVQLSFLGFCKVVTAGKDGSGGLKYLGDYTEILSFISDEINEQHQTFADQTYAPRQRLRNKGRLNADSLKIRRMGEMFQDQIGVQIGATQSPSLLDAGRASWPGASVCKERRLRGRGAGKPCFFCGKTSQQGR